MDKSIINSLKQSPLYNLSMANKELFHSNFLAWFGRVYPKLFHDFINDLLEDKYQGWDKGLEDNTFHVEREFQHFDICVIDKDGRIRLVIENKIKSIPTKKQLEGYVNDVQKTNSKKNDAVPVAFILLSMNTDFQDEKNKDLDAIAWIRVDYKKLSTALSKIKIKDDYHQQLIDDYCLYVENLQTVIEEYDKTVKFLITPEEEQTLKELDIHDLCGKRRMQLFYQILYNKLSKTYIFVGNREELRTGASNKKIYMGWGFSHSSPMLTIIFKTNRGDDAQIQIQGQQYRHGIEIADEQMQKRIIRNKKGKNDLSEEGKKYILDNYAEILLGNDVIKYYPTFSDNQELGQREDYCKFAPKNQVAGKYLCFVYQYVKIPMNIDIYQLADELCKDVDRIWGILRPASSAK